jgi:hypothetical protein
MRAPHLKWQLRGWFRHRLRHPLRLPLDVAYAPAGNAIFFPKAAV